MPYAALTAGARPAPSLLTAVASVQQQGTESGGSCVLPYVFRLTFSVDRVVPNHTITIAMDSGSGFADELTSVALDGSPQDVDLEGKYADGAGSALNVTLRAKIIRTSDGALIDSMDSNTLNETASACVI